MFIRLTPFPTRGSAIASPSENLIETRFALDRDDAGHLDPLLAGESAGGREEETMSTNLLTSAASLTVAGDVRRRFMKPQQAGEGWVDGSGRSRPAR